MPLLNVLLPFLFFEIYSIAIFFIVVVAIETVIIKQYLKRKSIEIAKICFIANIWTTVLGYFLQGIFRFFIGLILFLLTDKLNDNPFYQGLIGNVGITEQVYKDSTLQVLTTIMTSSVVALILSIYFEKKIFFKRYGKQIDRDLISRSVVIANIVSYTFLAVWIYMNYQIHLNR